MAMSLCLVMGTTAWTCCIDTLMIGAASRKHKAASLDQTGVQVVYEDVSLVLLEGQKN